MAFRICILSAWAFFFAADSVRAQRIDESQSVFVIEVPVQVLKAGKPLRGLTVDNFEIFDEGARQEILSIEVVDLTGAAVETESTKATTQPAPPKGRYFVLFFDLFFSTRRSLNKAIDAAGELVTQGLHVEDRVAVILFSFNRGMLLLENFTTDRARVTRSLETLALMTNPWRRRAPKADPPSPGADLPPSDKEPGAAWNLPKLGRLEPILLASREALAETSDSDPASARIKKHLDQMAHMRKLGAPRAQSHAVIRMAYELAMFANTLKEIQGGKYLVFLSEGFHNTVLLGDRYAGMIQVHLNKMLDVFRHTGWAFHTVDIKGLRPFGADATHDGLFLLARDTGGKFYRNYNNVNKAMTRVVESTSVTYLIAFQPRELTLDGRFHRLRVKLKNVPFGARVQYSRPGYFAPLAVSSY